MYNNICVVLKAVIGPTNINAVDKIMEKMVSMKTDDCSFPVVVTARKQVVK